jgi:glutamate 5-kinase
MTRRPSSVPDLQMTAAIGQLRLMAIYEKLFAAERCRVGQVLLTHGDLKDRRRHLNARNTVLNLLRHDVVPIVNENDVVAVEEIQLGDNDLLASLVAHLIQADLLVLLTTVDGLREPTAPGRTRRVSHVPEITDSIRELAGGSDSHLSVGGMATKLQAADDVARAGGMAVIASGRRQRPVSDILKGLDVGTLVGRPGRTDGNLRSGRKRWIAFFHRAQGALEVDDGAGEALCGKGRSLLPIGIRKVVGSFNRGDVVNIQNAAGRIIARGLVEYSSEDIEHIKGKKTTEIARTLGRREFNEVIHRDNMAIL